MCTRIINASVCSQMITSLIDVNQGNPYHADQQTEYADTHTEKRVCENTLSLIIIIIIVCENALPLIIIPFEARPK